jgi:hypothetical protein
MTAPTGQFDRLLELARQVVPSTTEGELFDLVMEFPEQYRSKLPAALEAMLCSLLGEAPPWAVQLAEDWERRAKHKCLGGGYEPCLDCTHEERLEACADELRDAARGEP